MPILLMLQAVFNLPSPIQKLSSPLLSHKSLELHIKRDDLIHPVISGNKWRKLELNLLQAKQQNQDTLLTFGGAWSNHIHATAAAGKFFGFKTIGIIRGEPDYPTATLQDAKSWGMHLHFVSRETYRKKHQPEFNTELKKIFGDFYLIPEGGRNLLAVQGCAKTIDELDQDYDVICVDCGTGTTMAGIITGLSDKAKVLGFAVLKGADFLRHDIKELLHTNNSYYDNWQLITDYHFGGYAKAPEELMEFMGTFEQEYHVPLEPVYSAKMMYGIFDLINKDFFAPNTRILAIHGGGLQGLRGFKEADIP